jgi:hypothetical protein
MRGGALSPLSNAFSLSNHPLDPTRGLLPLLCTSALLVNVVTTQSRSLKMLFLPASNEDEMLCHSPEAIISPSSWKSPTLDGQFTPFCLQQAFSETLPPVEEVHPKTPGFKPTLPIEIWDEIAKQCVASFPRKVANKTLTSLSLTSKRLTLPTQRALLRSVKLYEPRQIDRLVVTLLGKPYLGLQTKSLEIKVAKPDIYAGAGEPAQRAQELSLLPLRKSLT